MISKESIKYSLKNLTQNKQRSLLTILSIFVGITTIFIFISFGAGLYAYVDEFTTGSSADKITIMSKGPGAPGLDDTFGMLDDDLNAIKQTSGVYEVEGLYAKAAEITKDTKKTFVFIISYDPKTSMIMEVSNIEIIKGRNLVSGDTKKVVLGYNYLLPDKIFPKAYELNDKIEINGVDHRIIGFYEAVGNPQDDSQIYTNNDYMEEFYIDEVNGYSWVMARVDPENIENIIENVERNLRNNRNLEKGKEDFFVQSWQELMETYSSVLNGIVGFIILIALISVFVSAINTANTMITSVLERTKEIGVMKAVGAKNAEIFKIFLFESATLGLAAGAIGVFIGWIITSLTGAALDTAGWSFLAPYYSWSLFLGLILFATLTGAISGAIPALNASKTNPVEALRYE